MSQESNEKSTQSPMLPVSWVDKIFSTMLAHYGSKFSDMWRDADIADVKAVWAEKLGGFRERPSCLKYALDCLDGRQWPPTLPEFISDCRRAPTPVVRQIEHKLSDEDIDRNKARLKSISESLYRSKSA